MVWKDEGQREAYLKFRADPKRVKKKKKYLNAWYKKNRDKQLAYKHDRLRGPLGDKIRAYRRAWKAKKAAERRAQGVSNPGNLILTEDEMYMLYVWCGLEAAHGLPKQKWLKQRRDAKKGGRVSAANRQKRIDEAMAKYGNEIMALRKKLQRYG